MTPGSSPPSTSPRIAPMPTSPRSTSATPALRRHRRSGGLHARPPITESSVDLRGRSLASGPECRALPSVGGPARRLPQHSPGRLVFLCAQTDLWASLTPARALGGSRPRAAQLHGNEQSKAATYEMLAMPLGQHLIGYRKGRLQ